jgi:hypothetical protein
MSHFFDPDAPEPDFPRYYPISDERHEFQKSTIHNVEPVDESKLTPVKPSDLKVNKYYLILNRETHAKTRGKFVKVEKMFSTDDYVESFDYIFEDKLHGYKKQPGRLTISNDPDDPESFDVFPDPDLEDDEDVDPDPFDPRLKFDPIYGVFLPQTGKIIGRKTSKKLPAEMMKKIGKYIRGGKSRKMVRTRTQHNKRRRSTRHKK